MCCLQAPLQMRRSKRLATTPLPQHETVGPSKISLTTIGMVWESDVVAGPSQITLSHRSHVKITTHAPFRSQQAQARLSTSQAHLSTLQANPAVHIRTSQQIASALSISLQRQVKTTDLHPPIHFPLPTSPIVLSPNQLTLPLPMASPSLPEMPPTCISSPQGLLATCLGSPSSSDRECNSDPVGRSSSY